MTKKNIAVIMGGYSSEFEISLYSGEVVYTSLSKKKYNVYRVHILKEKWVHQLDTLEEFEVNRADFSFSDGKNTIHPDWFLMPFTVLQVKMGYYQLIFNLLECLTPLAATTNQHLLLIKEIAFLC